MSTAPALPPSDPARVLVPLPSGPAAYTDEGEGPVILAVPGLPGSGRDFRHLAPWLARGARVLRLDMPGFGETPAIPGAGLSPTDRARFVIEFVRALGLARPTLLGHSMGGIISVAAVDLAPEAFAGLALISTPGVTPHVAFRKMPIPILDAIATRPWLAAPLRPLIRRVFERGGFRGHSDAAHLLTFRCIAAMSFPDHAERLRRVALPTLVAYCADDPQVEVTLSDELAALCPPGPRLRFDVGGHNPLKAHAEALASALLGWVGELDRARDRG